MHGVVDDGVATGSERLKEGAMESEDMGRGKGHWREVESRSVGISQCWITPFIADYV